MLSSKNKEIQSLSQILPSLASSDASVLIVGESGTGKEMLAKLIHSMSPRSQRELISVNCAAIPEELLESELFGHKKGSFTGAVADHKGLFEQAENATLFLDEIGDMPLALQSKILRVLQEKKIRPVGGGAEKQVNFKLISATHRNLKEEIAKGRFREDLYYRISVVPLYVPALRSRREDIPGLAQKFLSHFSKKYDTPPMILSIDALENLVRRPWPGNVRELQNVMEYVSVMYRGKRVIESLDLPDPDGPADSESEFDGTFARLKKYPTVSELTDEYIRFILSQVDLHQGEAARILGLSRRTIYRKLRSPPAEESQIFN